MNCKNCGAKLNPQSPVCPNCGARVDGAGYVLLTADDRIPEMEVDMPPVRRNPFTLIIAIILLVAILATGGYFVASKYVHPTRPEMTFTSGYGIINGDEPVIYVKVGENAQLEYIHGVKLFAYDKSEDGNIGKVLSEDYEYTKSVDGTFRTIFFDASDFDVSADSEYTYTFEMDLSFAGKPNVYTYDQTIEFPGNITGDASDVVFDHSMDSEEQTTEPTTEPATEPTTAPQETQADISFIYSSFWYMAPFSDNETYKISSVKFEKSGKCSFTHFYKSGNSPWSLSTTTGTYELKGSTLYVTDSEGMIESYTVDSANQKLTGLESRKYNSTKNAEDFFGI